MPSGNGRESPDTGTRPPVFLRIENLVKKFGAFTALNNIDLEVFEGEFVCFLGPSGCGKTTLLRAIAGLDIQTSGRIEQAGRDISVLPPTQRDFGIVFQSYALFPNLTVHKNIAYGLENRKMRRAEINQRVEELLDLVGLADQGDKYPAQLSGGQQQRVALARAIATSPGLLLLDEPLSALDAKVRGHLRHEIKALQRRLGVTTIMVTHDQEEALTMADRIVVMNHGVIEQIGSPIEVYRAPATVFVADFIGTMNFVPGRVAGPEQVRIGDIVLSCDFEGLSPETPVTVAIRPEDIIVEEARLYEGNVFQVRISALEFLGSFFRADLANDHLGEARLRADISINQVRSLGLSEGQDIHVRLPRDRIRIYAGAATHG
ncbi:MAG: putative 2-aminoethylphosphonate ABC transporter ATP-binding protein [Alphaproteobacteria bacterium]|nr:MAG: putative 2-aminoethylphosphonate ABC transporter ATP-binding protein [Alphaproteobacteria bacterium]